MQPAPTASPVVSLQHCSRKSRTVSTSLPQVLDRLWLLMYQYVCLSAETPQAFMVDSVVHYQCSVPNSPTIDPAPARWQPEAELLAKPQLSYSGK